MYLSSGVPLSWSFATVSKLFCCEFFEIFVILLAILLQVKLPDTFAVGSASADYLV